ncbi:hypothetical protein CYLTODRAFT_492466 [Cylindrobasidium torrendii FP15055 ss-10]|uniref:RRM Nup35-type domain-containing protein n=1 Tax=Cylindrobasidium torrendii FP15055 ss-10 TaxID=1314674 RepID=A0A0D7B6X6_9AGAR|nr:hypothetical protein CYLTODRAFT_492466 [Cylindrobasidium torrendii FP15055 ss-10]
MYNSQHGHGFSVAGMPTPSSSTFGSSTLGSSTSNVTSGGPSSSFLGTSTTGHGHGAFNPGVSASSGGPASSYKSGYLLSASSSSPDAFLFESSTAPPGERTLGGGSRVGGGVLSFSRLRGGGGGQMEDSMFGGRPDGQGVEDEDGPPRESVVDIPGMRALPSSSSFSPSKSSFRLPSAPEGEYTYVMVYGYPADAYAQAVSFFKGIAEHPEDDVVVEQPGALRNAVRIGYRDPADAVRALRRDGTIVGGEWMVGVKSAGTGAGAGASAQDGHGMQVDAPSIGTPIKLVSQRSVFKTAGPATPTPADPVPSPTKGVVGQMTDLIFGW